MTEHAHQAAGTLSCRDVYEKHFSERMIRYERGIGMYTGKDINGGTSNLTFGGGNGSKKRGDRISIQHRKPA